MDSQNNSNIDRVEISDIHPKETKANLIMALSRLGCKLGEHFKNLKKAPGIPKAFLTFDTNEQCDEVMRILEDKTIDGRLKIRSNSALVSRVGPPAVPEAPVKKSAGPAPLQGTPYEEQLVIKAKEVRRCCRRYVKGLFKKGGPAWLTAEAATVCYSVPQITPSPILEHYRNKTDLSFGLNSQGKIAVGLTRPFAEGSGIYDPSEFNLMPEKSIFISEQVSEIFTECKWTDVYSRHDQSGYWRALRLRLPENGVPLVTVETCDGDDSRVRELCKRLDQAILNKYNQKAGFWHKINRTLNDAQENHDQDWTHISGPETTTETINRTSFTISPNSFFQCNSSAAEKLFARVVEIVGNFKPSIAIDCCCGAGAIGCILATNLPEKIRVVGVDIVESAIKDAKINAELNGLSDRTEWVCGPAEDKLPEVFEAAKINENDTVVAVLDPPRGGLHKRVTRLLRENKSINKLVYVSCNPESLGQDLARLIEPSEETLSFKVTSLEAFDLFPDTPHVESVAILERCTESEAAFVKK